MASNDLSGRGYAREYSENGFWDKLKQYAQTAGREVIERALQLYYALQDPATPVWAKTVIIGALGYFISIVDAIPDLTPLVGYTDDLGVLAAAVATLAANITEDHKNRARDKMHEWFRTEE